MQLLDYRGLIARKECLLRGMPSRKAATFNITAIYGGSVYCGPEGWSFYALQGLIFAAKTIREP